MSMRYFFADEVDSLKSSIFCPCMIVVQARLGSTRLPGKVLKPINNKPLLSYQLERLRRVSSVEGIVVATTLNPNDQPLVDYCNLEGVHCIRGSEEDVLSRYVAAASAFGLEAVVRVTADCPLIDPRLIEMGLSCFFHHYDSLDYLSICHERTFPLGMDFEIVRVESLKKAFFEAKLESEKEHVTPYIWKRGELFRLANLQQKEDLSSYRLTVDTQEDFTLVEHVINALYPKKPEFTFQDTVAYLQEHPELLQINAHIVQKRV